MFFVFFCELLSLLLIKLVFYTSTNTSLITTDKQQMHETTFIYTTYVIVKNLILDENTMESNQSIVRGDVTNGNRFETGF